jgi:uncharacterized membrane protein required for colicin V production
MVNLLDIVIVSIFLAIIGLGFINGISRVASALIAIYFGTVFACAFYRPLTDLGQRYISAMGRQTGELFFFASLLVISSTIFAIVIQRWLGDVKLPRRIEIIDNAGGAALGVGVAVLAVTLAAMFLAIMLQALNQTLGGSTQESAMTWLRGQLDASVLVPIFVRMTPVFTQIIEPWFPRGLPPILSGVPLG